MPLSAVVRACAACKPKSRPSIRAPAVSKDFACILRPVSLPSFQTHFCRSSFRASISYQIRLNSSRPSFRKPLACPGPRSGAAIRDLAAIEASVKIPDTARRTPFRDDKSGPAKQSTGSRIRHPAWISLKEGRLPVESNGQLCVALFKLTLCRGDMAGPNARMGRPAYQQIPRPRHVVVCCMQGTANGIRYPG